VVQECLTNVARHSTASRVEIELRAEPDDGLHMRVRDNGVGFGAAPRPAASFGVLGMRERVLALDGSLQLGNHPEGGALVRVWLPLPQREEALG